MISAADRVFDVLVNGPASVDHVHRLVNRCSKDKLSKRQTYLALNHGKRFGYLSQKRGVWQICGS